MEVQPKCPRVTVRTCMSARTRLNTRTQDTDKSRAIHQHAQSPLPWYFWILFLVLLVGILPNSCNGARANVHPQFLHHTSITRASNMLLEATLYYLLYVILIS